jgi:hypothetical protein
MTLPYEPPEPPELPEPQSKNTARIGIPLIVYKIVGLILLILLVYWVWRTYTRLPAAQPVQFPADYISYLPAMPPLLTRGTSNRCLGLTKRRLNG